MTNIRFEGVCKTFGHTRVLRDVHLEIKAGTLTWLLGPNGSGKSTLLRIAAGLSRPTSGNLYFEKKGVFGPKIGWLGHESLCYPDLTGKENILFSAALWQLERPEFFASRVAEKLELTSFWNRTFRHYSRGQRQRIALARTLVHSPHVLLLDEPNTGLDDRGLSLLVQVMLGELREGATLLCVTHDELFLNRLAGEKIYLERGRVTLSSKYSSKEQLI